MTKIKGFNRKPTEGSPNAGSVVNGGHGGDSNQHLIHRTVSKGASSNDDYVDSQFQQPPVRIPKKSILLASFLFIFGSILLVMATMSILNDKETLYMDRVLPMLILGALMFIPGFYHVRIAYLSWIGVAGYNFDDIPEFE